MIIISSCLAGIPCRYDGKATPDEECVRLVREGIRVEPCLIYEHPTDFAYTIDQVAQGRLQPARIVTSTHVFAGIAGAFSAAINPDESKVHCIL